MKINVKANEPHYLEIELEGEDIGLANALREILIEDKDVEFAASKLEHPQISPPTLLLRTRSKKAFDVFGAAVDKLHKDAAQFRTALKSAKAAKKSKSR